MRVLLVRAIACAGLSLLLLQHVVAAGTAVGTIVENTATVDFVYAGFPATQVSNTTTFQVAERIEVIVTPQSGQVVVLVNDTARSLLFTVTNTGNGTETFQLAINSIVAGDDFDPHMLMRGSMKNQLWPIRCDGLMDIRGISDVAQDRMKLEGTSLLSKVTGNCKQAILVALKKN